MNRKRKILRNGIFIAIFISFALLSGMFYIDPVAAYRGSERSIHYGPSEVVHVEDFPGGKYFLGKYDRWISCNIMQKSMGIFWSAGSYVTGTEIRYDHPIYRNCARKPIASLPGFSRGMNGACVAKHIAV